MLAAPKVPWSFGKMLTFVSPQLLTTISGKESPFKSAKVTSAGRNPAVNELTTEKLPPELIKTETDPIVAQIASEMGLSSTQYYTLEITPTFTVNADTTAGQIQQTFTPTLTVTFQRTEQGETTTIEPLYQTRSGALTENQTVIHYDIVNQRNASYILIAIAAAGLAFSTHFHMKIKPKTPEKPLEKVIAPYKDLIIEAKKPPTLPSEATIINVTSIQELAKTAEILAKPIILTKEPKPTLTIIDQNTVYQHIL